MARKSGISGQHRGAPAPTNKTAIGTSNGVPPPSTIAAQIVHNASSLRARQNPAAKVTFGQLVKEFLLHPTTDEPEPQLVALVCIIVEAGIDGLFKDDPFSQDQQREQGIDSISALHLIIQQKPHLLACAMESSDDGTPRPPILLWLLPKIIALLNHTMLKTFHERSRTLLTLCLQVLSSSTSFWRQNAAARRLYIQCTQSVLDELGTVDDPSKVLGCAFQLSLPSSGTISHFWPDSLGLVAVPHDLHTKITSPICASYIGLNMLYALVQQVDQRAIGSIDFTVLLHQLPWIQDSLANLWLHFRHWTSITSTSSIHNETLSLCLEISGSVYSTMSVSVPAYARSPRPSLLLMDAIAELLDLPITLSSSNQNKLAFALRHMLAISSALSRKSPLPATLPISVQKHFSEKLGKTIARVCSDKDSFRNLDEDLQLTLYLWLRNVDCSPDVIQLQRTLLSDNPLLYTNSQIQPISRPLIKQLQVSPSASKGRPTKRRRTSPSEMADENSNSAIYWKLKAILSGSQSDDPVLNLSDLQEKMQTVYDAMPESIEANENQQGTLLSAFARIACAGAQCLQMADKDVDDWATMPCSLCDSLNPREGTNDIYWDRRDCDGDWRSIIAAMMTITQEPKFQASSKSRILMSVAIGRVFNHVSDPEYLSLDFCDLGQWLLGSLTRSLRELKLTSARSLTVFLRNEIPKSYRQKNRRDTIEFLNTLAKRNVLSDQEAVIFTYGQVARICSEMELPIVLHQLVEYLGHPNVLICGMAYRELDSIAVDFKVHTTQLLKPYWRVLGFSVIKDVLNKPQKAQQLAELTEQSVRQLLVMTQTETLPHLVLTKRKDIIEKIAQARKESIAEVLTQPRRNLAKILALLLCQPVADVESNAMDILGFIEPAITEGSNNKLDALLALDITGVATEILHLATDKHPTDRKLFYRGFATLAALIDSKQGHRKSTSKNHSLELFCETHILGIIAYFSDIIEGHLLQGKPSPHPLPERKRSIAAIGELIAVARYSVNGALPQLRACLQSAMADPDLCDESFSVWTAFLEVLDSEDAMPVIDQTFALVVQHWTNFSNETQVEAEKTIVRLTQRYDEPLRARIEMLPSLGTIPTLSKTERELVRLKGNIDTNRKLQAFSNRCRDQNAVIVRQALIELIPFLDSHQEALHQSLVGQKPAPVLAGLTRALLDASVQFTDNYPDISVRCAQCLGIVGGLDPYRVETIRERKRVLMLSNFSRRDEDIDFVALLLEQVLVKVFLSTTNAKAQGWIAYVMQEMLKHCGFSALVVSKPRSSQTSTEAQRWHEIPETVRNVLTPFLSSRYSVNQNPSLSYESPAYPIFRSGLGHGPWLQTLVYDLLQKGQGVNVEMVFPVLARIVRGYDLSIATFMLPFAVLNIVVADDEQSMTDIGEELLTILKTDLPAVDHAAAMTIRQCSENVFQTLDYLSLWLQEKRKAAAEDRMKASRTGRGILEDDEMVVTKQISRVESILAMIPAEVISRRAVECGSYARALFHWEQYYRQRAATVDAAQLDMERDNLLKHLQVIYAQIDEPDSIEGISAHLKVLSPDQQIIENRKAGRWTAAQSWYELELVNKPHDSEIQVNLLTCLKESGQYDAMLNYVDGFRVSKSLTTNILPFAAEAAWSTGKWDQLEAILELSPMTVHDPVSNFNVDIGRALLALRREDTDNFLKILNALREALARGLSPSSTASLQACHEQLVKLHALYEVETISGASQCGHTNAQTILQNLDRRLEIIGAYTSDKQYLLSLRRATMALSRIKFTKFDIASAWLTSARLARKGDFMTTAFNAVMHAERLGDHASKLEYSKLLWKEGHHRKAIQNLQGALVSNVFQVHDEVPVNISVTTSGRGDETLSKVKCQAELLLAKWKDRAGQTKSVMLKNAFATGVQSFPRYDKGHYYLGRYYLKLLDSEKRLPVAKQSPEYLTGSLVKLVVENFARSTVYGTKYYYQTLPKILTLWLDMGAEVTTSAPRAARDKEFHEHKVRHVEHINDFLRRYAAERMPTFAWYTTFSQIITRISHPNSSVWDVLQSIIVRVGSSYPQQALWSLLALLHSTQESRRARGLTVLQRLRETSKRKGSSVDLKSLIIHGQRLTDGLLAACDAPVEPRVTHVSLSKNLGFNHKLLPSQLVVPIEANLLPSLPAGNDSRTIRSHNPFPQDTITIHAFSDEVLVLSSLARPRKVNVRGSDGRSYSLLCKPKDDLRKDQRLMEFNAMINRALRKNIESSKRRLYIKTYAVTPLNEECGTIEWVEGLKPMRDILIRFYRQHHVAIDYGEIRALLNEASSSPSRVSIFSKQILGKFPPVFHEWFVETFPEPETWFAARLRYTRSCAVMSIVGHGLGLGDRHGENVLIEQGDGGTFHVDFNCLFDKGLTFEKPELVPFRLTHNMVDAMGPQGVEGPFRKAAELTYALLRQHEDTLITILETFVHDPTADFLGRQKRRKIPGVPDTPQEVLDNVRTKVNGYLKGESVPLSVEGYVDALIAMATDPVNLAAMYIGWCAFF